MKRHGSRTSSLAGALALVLKMVCGAPALAGSGLIHLGAGDCAGAGSETAAITNSCTSNTGAITLYVSFSPPVPMNQFVGMAAAVDIFTNQSTLSPWWHAESGGCRQSKISVGFNFTSGPTTCTDFWSGQAFGGMDYGPDEAMLGPNTARLRAVCAISNELAGAITPSVEYYALAINISKAQSTGPGSCAGCTDKVCFVVNSVQLGQLPGVGDYTVTQGTQTVVTYNGGSGGSQCASVTNQKTTWGAIKSIYH
jgi:hypothetical protein